VHPTFNQSDSVRQRYAFGELADHHKALSQRDFENAVPRIRSCLRYFPAHNSGLLVIFGFGISHLSVTRLSQYISDAR
jgi:hypothetical protein